MYEDLSPEQECPFCIPVLAETIQHRHRHRSKTMVAGLLFRVVVPYNFPSLNRAAPAAEIQPYLLGCKKIGAQQCLVINLEPAR